MPDPSRQQPISAVFVLEPSAATGPMLAAWIAKGHRIAAIVVPAPRSKKRFSVGTWRRRWRRRLVLRRHVGAVDFPLIEFGRPYDWTALARQFSSFSADVLICFGFNTIIPDAALKPFAKGGLNLHPALLPHYRGPHPIHRLVIDQQQDIHGGVTLHRMSPAFDEGDILAQVAFSGDDWHSAATISRALASGMALLAAEAAPDYCAGALSGKPQPAGDYVWAQLSRMPLVVDDTWSSAHIARIWNVVGRSVAINVLVDGNLVRLAYPVGRVGPAQGKPPIKRLGRVEFDCADGRYRHLIYSGFYKSLLQWQRLLSRLTLKPKTFEIRRF